MSIQILVLSQYLPTTTIAMICLLLIGVQNHGYFLYRIMGNEVFAQIQLLNMIVLKINWNNANRWLKQKHIPSINIFRAHSRSIFNGLQVIIKNQFLYGANEWSFYFRNATVALYWLSCTLFTSLLMWHISEHEERLKLGSTLLRKCKALGVEQSHRVSFYPKVLTFEWLASVCY